MQNFQSPSQDHLIVIAIIVLAVLVVYFVPIVRIVQRTGHSGWWVLLALIPFGNIIGLWLLGFGRWPALEK
jgi:hypothetical protein